jgi:endonuclease III
VSGRRTASPATVLDALCRAYGGPTEFTETRPLDQIILWILARGSDFRRAQSALKRLQAAYVDWNEVRVTSAYELRKITGALGSTGPADKADQIKEVLSTIFERFNKLSLDFLLPASAEPDAGRKRERFLSWFLERFPVLAALVPLFGQDRKAIASHPGLVRVFQRLGWLPRNGGGIGAMKAAMARMVGEGDLLRAQWAFIHLAETTCVPRQPLCGQCVAATHCPTAPRSGGRSAAARPPAARKDRTKGRTRVRK